MKINSLPQVSVILPFYNAEGTLHYAIDSIANQTMQNFECVLIDNNSTDSSKEMAETWVKNDSRFLLVSENEQGVVFASNKGASIAKGRYIARMDADDWAFPKRLELQAKFLDDNPDFGVVAGLVEYIGHNENTEGFQRYVDWSNSLKEWDDISRRRFMEMPFANPTVMWRRELGEKLGLYRSGSFPEDYEMWLRWMSKGVRIHKLNQPVIKWFDSDTRLTRTKSIYSVKSFYTIKSKYLAEWLAENNPMHPRVAVWGASKISRRRVKLLENCGIEVSCYIDTKHGRQLHKPVMYYTDIPSPGEMFILTYIQQANARDEIQDFLESKGYVEGTHYLLVS